MTFVETHDTAALRQALADVFSYGPCILAEEFIKGREVRAGVIEVREVRFVWIYGLKGDADEIRSKFQSVQRSFPIFFKLISFCRFHNY